MPTSITFAFELFQTFTKTVAQKDRITVVDFYADWCGPCRQLSPILEKLTDVPNQSKDGLPFDLVKIDTETDDGQSLAGKFKVRLGASSAENDS